MQLRYQLHHTVVQMLTRVGAAASAPLPDFFSTCRLVDLSFFELALVSDMLVQNWVLASTWDGEMNSTDGNAEARRIEYGNWV